MRFEKYDLAPLESHEYRENVAFLVDAYRAEEPLSFGEYFENLEPRVLDGVVENSIIPENKMLEIGEQDLATIGESVLGNMPENNPRLEEFFNSPDLFEEYYDRTNWQPETEITDSSKLEQYKLDSPYSEKIHEFDRKSAVNHGRELPTFIGWAAGIPAAFETGSPIIAGGGAGFLLG